MNPKEDTNYKGRFFIENKVIPENTKNFKTSRPNMVNSDSKKQNISQRTSNNTLNIKNLVGSLKGKNLNSGKLYNSTKLRLINNLVDK